MPKYMTKKELLSLLKISSTTFERWLREGRLPEPVQISRLRRWKIDEIMRLLDASKAAQGA